MRGLKAMMAARAQAERVSVSALVRGALARDFGPASDGEASRPDAPVARHARPATAEWSIRMTADEARCASRWRGECCKRGGSTTFVSLLRIM
jgi:hypothetical protein